MSRRCTYCLESKPDAAFTTVEHVMPAALGGEWKTRQVCDACQERANEVADQLIVKDFLVVFLRAAYQVGDRNHRVPLAPRFEVPLDGGGVVKVTLDSEGTRLEGATSPAVAALLGIQGASARDQDRLRELVGDDVREKLHDPVELARARQIERTPPMAWSRFMAKLALACGRKAYGDSWMDGPHARQLSADLRSDEPPKLAEQREHFPPLGETWPFLPPRHVLWIDDVGEAAVLHVVIFGQVLGAVPINQAGAPSEYSAWRFDPKKRDFNHSSYPAIWHAMVAVLATQSGRNVVSVLAGKKPFTFIEDGAEGPMDIPVLTLRADSALDAVNIIARHQDSEEHASPPPTVSDSPSRRQPGKVGRNELCPCGSGRKYKRCCGG
jgi:HNH endonuclease/SEC-C motif